MIPLLAICAVILTAAVCTAVFYLVGTLKQVRVTAAALEKFLAHADESAHLFKRSAKIVSHWVEGADGVFGKAAPFLMGLFSAFRGKTRGRSNGEEEKYE